MRFTDVRLVAARPDRVWTALHDPDVLRGAIPGCRDLDPIEAGRHAATLAVSVGRLTDTYRGTFDIEDHCRESDLTVAVDGRGRFGRLQLELRVRLEEGPTPSTTALAYDARATVSGLVARLGRGPLTVAGGQLTGRFFRDLDRVLRVRAMDEKRERGVLARG